MKTPGKPFRPWLIRKHRIVATFRFQFADEQMSKNKRKPAPRPAPQPAPRPPGAPSPARPLLWVLAVCAVTAATFFPMLSNGFTNWDDQFYITDNPMLLGPDWATIFTTPLMANYHPLTVASLALNHMVSGLSPFSYHLVNWTLHIVNTGLVFFLAYRLSNGQRWVGAITALLFGIHPMHVESVAWASERKDVLFAFFFLLSLLSYLRYLQQPDGKKYMASLVLFALSLLSKPASVPLPVVLLLIDWYQGRSLSDKKVWLEKIPFFVLAVIFGWMALNNQHAVKAIAATEMYPFWQKLVFSFYGFGAYLLRMIWPFPLSALHPFPASGVVPAAYFPSIIFGVAVLAALWFFRKKRYVLFGAAFFLVNIALVLQLLTFGHSIISERYTYVPYIGLGFAVAMAWAESGWQESVKKGLLGVILLACLGFAAVSFRQVQVWKNGYTLWSNVIKTYPDNYLARSNRGQFLSAKQGKYDEALADYAIALQSMPNDSFSLINRATIYLNQQNYPAALADGDSLVKYHAGIAKGHFLRGFAADQLGNAEQALEDYTQAIRRDSFSEEVWRSRAVLRYNKQRDFTGAKEDFDRAIRLDPGIGQNYKNRARCWIKFGKKAEALKDLEMAKKLGEKINDDLMQAAQSLPNTQ